VLVAWDRSEYVFGDKECEEEENTKGQNPSFLLSHHLRKSGNIMNDRR